MNPLLDFEDFNDSSFYKIDKRIIKEDYRNYDLVTRFWHGSYRGKIWKHNANVGEIEGDNLDAILQHLRSMVDELIDDKLLSSPAKQPTKEELKNAFQAVEHKLDTQARRTLLIHANESEATISIQSLRSFAGFDSTTDVLLCYAGIARRLCDELGFRPTNAGHQSTALSVLLDDNSTDSTKITLQPSIVAVIQEMNWLAEPRFRS
jgi:hypothetical protein